jgi:multicomponent Na+:H+ antiporter subunit D
MSRLLIAVFALAGIAGVTLWLLPLSGAALRRIALSFAAAKLALAIAIVRAVAGGDVLVHGFGGWAPPFGIVFVADRLAALFVLLLAMLLLFTVWTLRPGAYRGATVARVLPLLFLLAFGLTGAFLTGDLFNLFVMFEVVLLASYLLLQVPGGDRSLRAAFPNIAINLVASLLFFIGVGLLYGATGTVNLADLAGRIGDAPVGLRVAAVSMLAVAFGIKAGLVPFLYWLPATYPALSGPVAALFAGMMTKLGVYALARTVPLLMQGTPLPTILVWAGAVSALVAVLAALSEYELRRLLGFHITSQVGYMVLGIGLMTRAAIAGAIFYLVHHVLVKAALFFVADELERRSGTRDLRSMRAGAAGPAIAVAFVVAGFSLAGLPPFSGFFAKLGLLRGAFDAGEWVLLAVMVVASYYTLASMLKVWQAAFGAPSAAEDAGGRVVPVTPVPLLGLVAISAALALAAGPVFSYAEATADQMLDVDAYVAAVSGVPGRDAAALKGGLP